MTERPVHDVSFELGGIKSSLDTITRTLSENRTADAQYRTSIRAEMKVQSDAIGAVATDMIVAKNAIADMKPKVESLDDRAKMSKGAQNLAVILAKAAHIISAAIGGAIVFFLTRWLGTRP